MLLSWDIQSFENQTQNGLQHQNFVNLLTVNYVFDKCMDRRLFNATVE
jgi:hypothetical protein